MFSVATNERLVLFDYGSEEPVVVSGMEVANVIQITFFDCHVVLCCESDESDDITLSCYETEGFIEGQEPVGSIVVKRFLGQKIMFRTDNFSIYYAAGK